MPAGTGAVALPILALTALAGVALGVGGYTFVYAQGSSYLTDDPAACANCHVMQQQYDGWRKGPHHHAAVCNDCHVPSGAVQRVAVKLLNGWHHSSAFTTGDYPDAILLRERSRSVVEERCQTCHADLVAAMGGPGVSCIRCHESVGHAR
jgi:cytochrome c nitrite reductase small subunit